MSEKKVFEYPGEKVDVAWHGALCIHISECGRAKGELFVGGRTPWCQPDLVSEKETAEVVERCPTGALTYHFKDGSQFEKPAAENTATVVYNGPYYFSGALEIENAPENAPGLKFRAALCRCGASKNKPYCDNSHIEAGFADYGAVGESGEALSDTGGELTVKCAPDGPLLVSGNLSIIAATGRRAWQGSKVALCRCGASGNKPFCDGSHKEAGFKSD